MAPTHRMIGTTDDVIDCERCGKPDLRMTVILEWLAPDGTPTGEVVYYGSTCAARALADRGTRTTAARVRSAAIAAQAARVRLAEWMKANLDYYGLGVDEPLTEERIEVMVPLWRERNKISGYRLRSVEECRERIAETYPQYQATVREVLGSRVA